MPIYKRTLKSGREVYDVKVSSHGKQYWKRGLRTQGAAKKIERDMQDWRGGHMPNLTFEELTWLWLKKAVGSKSSKTIEDYSRLLRLHVLPSLGRRRVVGIRPTDVEAIIQGLKDRPRTANMTLTVIRAVFRQAQAWELTDTNPAASIYRVPDPPKEAEFLTQQEAVKMTEAAEGQDALLILVALSSGLRPGELRALTWQDVDGRDLVVRDAKTPAGNRRVRIPAGVAEQLAAARRPGGHVFTMPDGSPLTKGNMRSAVERVAKAAGIKKNVTPHTLRHTYAALCTGAGYNLKFISQQMGHTNVAFTMTRYGHLAPDAKEAIVDAFENEVVANLYHAQSKQKNNVVHIHR